VKLTNRETDIVELFRDRLTDKDIALKLGISLSTVKRHNINIFNKLQVSSKQQALEVLSKM
ncbi:MAG: LuxR C-terminal-related transcriptional regulator, partial [Schleiferiaceae bacterium]|nr:LuxR C-terminal-related transcriptional regulator [Schleiferiaceae bacterium]